MLTLIDASGDPDEMVRHRSREDGGEVDRVGTVRRTRRRGRDG
jgi:hypothetical protein